MKPAEDKLWEDLKQIKIMAPKFDIFSNYWAKPLTAPEDIREALRLQVCGRVKWLESMQQMSARYQPEAALEFGEGEVLTNMLKRINPELRRININGLECLSNLS